jgi:TRAP-type mannitol/chloroaromatic compound transport system permease large subunit
MPVDGIMVTQNIRMKFISPPFALGHFVAKSLLRYK